MDKIRLSGHIWTVASRLIGNMAMGTPRGEPWRTTFVENGRTLGIAGNLLGSPQAKSLVVILHGLGGGAASPYCRHAMAHLGGEDLAILSLAMRGADRSGEDYYHCGLTADLHALMKDPFTQQFDHVFLLGFSVGGHVALKFASEAEPGVVTGVAAICCPLDLGACSKWMDGTGRNLYRRHVMRGLKEMYTLVAEAGHEVPTPVEEVQAVEHFQDWDQKVVVPRYGFNSVEHYYQSQSVAYRMHLLKIPSLLIVAENDPMVPSWTIKPLVDGGHPNLDVRWVRRGGHLGFPRKLDLGLGGEEDRGLARQILSWYHAQAAQSSKSN